ncbi:MAG: two-component sensor histidine kinase, partial [Alphaproteobacteria bacterium]|nr:two-component sensor histidine kinase [Alphaproteobacteria bacterium]
MQLRNYMPKTLFARMLAIILVPMLLVQCITVLIFYERHWDSVTRHMAYSLSGEISYIVSQAGSTPTMEHIPALQMLAGRYFGFSVLFTPDAILPPENPDIDRSF